MEKFLVCAKCGAKSTHKQFIENFCVDCFPFNLAVPARRIAVIRCRRCGKMKLAGKWLDYNVHAIEDYVASKCRGEFDKVMYDLESGMVIFHVRRGGSFVKVEKPYAVEFHDTTCKLCNKKTGGYYQAIIQLRGNPKRIPKYEKILQRLISQKSFISRSEKKKEGTDLYVGDSKVAFQVLQMLKLHFGVSRKLAGLERGKRIYRTTLVVRLE